ncbi:HNH endonuclease signature motif containing protein [Actinomadura opuntiae]|uniref:HNH endonuclease signature motif containing protein n=1 Tax=Actinomadura sp. OS1-43 TaxID=604315 RepID=UPI00255AB76C|nr:HNH endonuclease signature motif containing protein [Actinomadura sp. OS1-43]MDL4816184.1 DUF222 domain-containing protein [Actinomadura sp. OS1-43]
MALPAEIAEVVGDAREWEGRSWFPPGPQLAVCLSGGKERLADLTDGELLEVAAAARRQTSWAQARELAAIAELAGRRADGDSEDDARVLSAHESVTDEVAAALTVTGNAAATLVHLAERLADELPATRQALEAGRIDLAKARVICDVTESLSGDVVEHLEAVALDKASGQTSGQLRRRITRMARRLAPDAIEERKRDAVRGRRLEVWENPSGTASLALCDLPPEEIHAIYNKISAAARGLKADGDPRPLGVLRVDLAKQLLGGPEFPAAVSALLAQAADTESSPQPADDVAIPALAAMVERRLADVSDHVPPDELPVAIRQAAQEMHGKLAQRRDAVCQGDDEAHGRPGYRPSAALRREIETRHATCVFPSCNRPSRRCDLDHTIPWRPGTTCRCNLAPLCRRHHRLKQSPGWTLLQLWPGLLIWTTPAGAWYIVRPDRT